MPPYKYSPLDPGEIRLVTLLPGLIDDDIRFSISHARFVVPQWDDRFKRQDPPTLDRIQRTLPPRWASLQTLEGDIIFCYLSPDKSDSHSSSDRLEVRRSSSPESTTHMEIETHWTHPDPSFDMSSYRIQEVKNEMTSLPRYEALSYTWGSKTKSAIAYVGQHPKEVIDGNPEPLTISLRDNLASAMRHLRYKDKTRTIWVDAICINQQDTTERNHEVRRMAHIFKYATRVIVWLGKGSPSSKIGMQTLEYLGKQLEVTDNGMFCPAPRCTESFWYDPAHPLPYSNETWDTINDVLSRDWFSRLWVVQEIQLGSRYSIVQCGEDVMDWSHFRRAVISLNNKLEGPSLNLRRSLVEAYTIWRPNLVYNLPDLLDLASDKHCSEQHDKVFAILGLVSPTMASKIQPDYNLPLVTVFRNVFLTYIEVVCRLDLMLRCDSRNQLPGAWPSWVPMFSASKHASHVGDEMCCAASSLSSAHTSYVSPNELTVIGISITRVSGVQSATLCSLDDAISVLRKLGLGELRKAVYSAGGTQFQAYILILCLGIARDRFPTITNYLYLKGLEVMFQRVVEYTNWEKSAQEADQWREINRRSIGRTIVLLQNGLVGTVSGEVKSGIDLIFHNCNSILIFSTNDDRY